MMDCVNFRRRLLEDPARHDWAMNQHEADCESCAGYAERVRRNEQQLRAMLSAPVPDELAERIQLAVRLDQKPQARPERRIWLATAASLLIAVTAGLLWMNVPHETQLHQASLSQSVLHHIDDETHVLRQPGPVGPYQVNEVFGRFGASVEGSLGPVSFAAECQMRHKTGVHLVLPGEMGAVTVLFMPGEMSEGTEPIVTERFAGQIYPMAWGSIAVVGERGEKLDLVVERVIKMVQWPAQVSKRIETHTGRTG